MISKTKLIGMTLMMLLSSLTTNNLCSFHSNGYLNTGGFRISPTEIEDRIQKIEGVIDVHVYGKPNSILGSIICADVIGEGISSKTLKLILKQQSVEKQLIPQIIRIVDSFEYVSNGKKKIIV